MDIRKTQVEDYVNAYNAMDVPGMLTHLHTDVVFENESQGKVEMRLEGKEAFRQQAEAALAYFSERNQTITDWQVAEDQITITVAYRAVLAMDFPNGMKKGDVLELRGSSVFQWDSDQIVHIVDRS